MPVTKISISLSPRALEVIDRLARHQGITRSAWIEQAAAEAARQAAIDEALMAYRREAGRPISARKLQAARRELREDAHANK